MKYALLIEDKLKMNKTQIFKTFKPYLKLTDSIDQITLKYNQNHFSFDFVALSFVQPSKNNYAYKLEGFDEEWNFIGNNTSATYTNINAGTYVFKVKASNNNGLWNEAGTSIKLIVAPAPWFTWWAYLIYFLIFLGGSFVVVNLILSRINDKNEIKKEKLEIERLEEVNKLKLELFTNISHEFRTPLTLISGPVDQLVKHKNNSKQNSKNCFFLLI